ncbi:hypothetical protein BJ508DRAFT_302809 [Ascobolus immersus RN42]|uniref:Uncharacterized protein n=1 Tax=Ascobolus immersus RN42 TaxID=1160509 RepID=A0A3N4II79_ASCIM|nr:hypothetical protein BJ508DRAFT_302809 [Ascobolus immersus RN42]
MPLGLTTLGHFGLPGNPSSSCLDLGVLNRPLDWWSWTLSSGLFWYCSRPYSSSTDHRLKGEHYVVLMLIVPAGQACAFVIQRIPSSGWTWKGTPPALKKQKFNSDTLHPM